MSIPDGADGDAFLDRLGAEAGVTVNNDAATQEVMTTEAKAVVARAPKKSDE